MLNRHGTNKDHTAAILACFIFTINSCRQDHHESRSRLHLHIMSFDALANADIIFRVRREVRSPSVSISRLVFFFAPIIRPGHAIRQSQIGQQRQIPKRSPLKRHLRLPKTVNTLCPCLAAGRDTPQSASHHKLCKLKVGLRRKESLTLVRP